MVDRFDAGGGTGGTTSGMDFADLLEQSREMTPEPDPEPEPEPEPTFRDPAHTTTNTEQAKAHQETADRIKREAEKATEETATTTFEDPAHTTSVPSTEEILSGDLSPEQDLSLAHGVVADRIGDGLASTARIPSEAAGWLEDETLPLPEHIDNFRRDRMVGRMAAVAVLGLLGGLVWLAGRAR